MNWTELLKLETTGAFHATLGLLDLVDEENLSFKPETGENWMTMGQLLMHLNTACGFCMNAFLTGEWGMPEGMSEEEMLPPAEQLPAVESVAQAQELVREDLALALATIDRAGEEDLAGKLVAAPWSPDEGQLLGVQFLHMVDHLAQHKGQLFYYLKLLGQPVHTGHLWGM